MGHSTPSDETAKDLISISNPITDKILISLAIDMVQNAGCPMAFAAWGRLNYPEVYAEMERRCDYLFRTPKALQDFLLEE